MSVEDDRKATETVLSILQDKSLSSLDFKFNKRTIQPSMYQKVAKAITEGKITVINQPNLLKQGSLGRYLPVITIDNNNEWYDVLVLRHADLGTSANDQFVRAASIIHECTHAGFDLLKLTKMTHLEHEAGSYIAATIFVVANLKLSKLLEKANVPVDPIGKAAWDIALLEVENKSVPKELYNALNVAISKDPNYKDNYKDAVNNDGVGRQWKIKP
jgi:hypothetical protein